MLIHQQTQPIEGMVARPQSPPEFEIADGSYSVRIARTPDEVDAALALRFDVFNLELGEGLHSSYLTGRDRDEYDAVCDHLIVAERATGRVVGTYRLMTSEAALATRGFYSSGEFNLAHLPPGVLSNSVELGRACVAREHRNTRVLFLLWRGIAKYLEHHGKRFLFGCCSLTSQDEEEGARVARRLERDGSVHHALRVAPRPGFECAASAESADARLPQLFGIYMRFGARVCSPPAVDRAFGTIDFLVIFDVAELDEPARRMFFGA
jgi:putative hemolysin